MLLQGRKTVLLMYDTDDIVNRIVVNRQTGIAALGKALGDLVHRGVVGHGHNIHAGGQHILGLDVVKLDGAADQLTLAVRQLAVLLGLADHGHQFTLGDGVLFSGIKPFGKELLPRTEQGVQRCKNRDQRTEHGGKGHGHCFGHFLGHALGGDFAKGQDQQGHDNRRDGRAVNAADKAGKQHGGKRGRTDIDNVIADQNGAEQAVVALNQRQRVRCFGVAVLRLAPQADLIQRVIRCFCRREKCRQTDQDYQCDDHKYTAIVHWGTINSFCMLFMCTTTHFTYYSIDMYATQRVRRQICVKTCFYLILEFLRFLLCKEGTKEAYGTHPLVRCCFARRAQKASPRGGEVAERQRWPVWLCPFPAARSLTGKLRTGHARPLRAMARCRVAAGAGGYGIRPYGGHRAKRQ